MVPWQRAAKPGRVERVMPRCSANPVRANFAAIWPGHALRLRQPRSGQLPIRGSVKLRPSWPETKLIYRLFLAELIILKDIIPSNP